MSGSKSSDPAAAVPPQPKSEGLELTVHSLPSPEQMAAQQRTRRGRWAALAVVFICALPVLVSYFTFYVIKPSGTAYGTLIAPAVEIPAALPLKELDGTPVTAESLKGQWLLIAVNESSCDKACEDRLFMQRQLREMLGKERDKLDKIWLVTDEAAVRPELIAAVTQKGTDGRILRVSAAALEAWIKPAKGRDLHEHLYVVDPMGRWMLREPANADPIKVKGDLNKLMKVNSGWDRPGR